MEKQTNIKDLKGILRNDFDFYILSLVKKEQCEVCDSVNGLEVHHINYFHQLLDDTLIELNLHDKEDFTNSAVNLIRNVMLGKQIKCEYLTLCENCHSNIHIDDDNYSFKYYEKYYLEKKLKRQHYIKTVLIPYLESIVEKRLHKKEKNELIDVINLRVRGRQQRSYSKFNDYFKENGINYLILPKKSDDVRYWLIVKTSK